MKLDWVLIVAVAVAAVGVMQWAKALSVLFPPKPGEKTVPDWVWALLLPLVVVGLAFLFSYTSPVIMAAIVALAVCQLGYENIVKLIQKKIDNLGDGGEK
jgi:hypothetical protein